MLKCLEKANLLTQRQIRAYLGWSESEHKGTLGDDRNVIKVDCGEGCTTLHTFAKNY